MDPNNLVVGCASTAAAVSVRETGLLATNGAPTSASRLSFEDEAAAPRGYDVMPASTGSISVRQPEVQTPVHNKHQIELHHCGKIFFTFLGNGMLYLHSVKIKQFSCQSDFT